VHPEFKVVFAEVEVPLKRRAGRGWRGLWKEVGGRVCISQRGKDLLSQKYKRNKRTWHTLECPYTLFMPPPNGPYSFIAFIVILPGLSFLPAVSFYWSSLAQLLFRSVLSVHGIKIMNVRSSHQIGTPSLRRFMGLK